METVVALTKILSSGGPWAISAILLVTIVWLWRELQISQKLNRDTLMEHSRQLIDLLERVIQSSERQQASNESVAKSLDELGRRVDNSQRNRP